jgi:branched-chain amino acid transport system substrate-binding protein
LTKFAQEPGARSVLCHHLRSTAQNIRVIASALALTGLALAGPACAEDAIRMGVLPSATGPGASIGAALTAGVDLAVSEINSSGGVLGRKIEIFRGDTQSNPTMAASEARRLIEHEKIEVLIGPLVSQEAVPTVDVATPAKIVQVTNAGIATLTPKVGPYHFSFNTSAATAAKVMVDFVADQLHAKTVGILADDGGQSRSGVAEIKTYLDARKITVAAEQEYHFKADDLSPQLLSLRRANPDALIFFTSTVEDGARMLRTLGEIGWQPQIVGATAMSVYGPAIARTTGAEAFVNVHSVAYKGMTYCSTDAEGASKYAEFAKKLKAFAPESANKISGSLAAEYYDAVHLIVAAIEATGGVDGDKLAKWIETNGSKVPLIHGAVSPSSESHFLFGPAELSVVDRPNELRADGLAKRSGC